jgi:hypothetical protein
MGMCNGSHLEPRNYLFVTGNNAPVMGFIDSLRRAINQLSLEFIVHVSWALSITRNDFIFKGIPPSIYRARAILKKEIGLLLHKAKSK